MFLAALFVIGRDSGRFTSPSHQVGAGIERHWFDEYTVCDPINDDGSDIVYLLEVNPRASRTVPFVSKATGVPLAKIAARCMTGKTLAEQSVTCEVVTGILCGEGSDLSDLLNLRERGPDSRSGNAFYR